MHVEQGELLLDAQKLFQSVLERIGGNDDGERCERISGFKRPDFFDQGLLKIGMVVSGDDLEHED